MNCSMPGYIYSSCKNDTIPANSTRLKEDAVSLFDALKLSLKILPIECVSLVLLSLSCLINSLVLTTLFKVSSQTLKAKFLLTSNLLANVGLPLTQKIPGFIIYMCMVFGLNNTESIACLELVTNFASPFGILFQGFCTFCLACDRVYAVCFPLTYKVKGYSKLTKCIILLCQVLLAACLLLPAIILPLRIKRPPVGLCTRLVPGFYMYTRTFRQIMMITQGLITFLVYIFVFIYLKYNSIVDTKEKHSKASSMLSLTVSYFLLHLTNVLLMSPAALYSLSLGAMEKPPTGNERMLLHLLATLMILNSITDPILLVNRIPELRKRLMIQWEIFPKTSDGIPKFPSPKSQEGQVM